MVAVSRQFSGGAVRLGEIAAERRVLNGGRVIEIDEILADEFPIRVDLADGLGSLLVRDREQPGKRHDQGHVDEPAPN